MSGHVYGDAPDMTLDSLIHTGASFYVNLQWAGGYTCRAEMRRNGRSWYAYKRTGGKLVKRYVGRDDAITWVRLKEVGQLFEGIVK